MRKWRTVDVSRPHLAVAVYEDKGGLPRHLLATALTKEMQRGL